MGLFNFGKKKDKSKKPPDVLTPPQSATRETPKTPAGSHETLVKALPEPSSPLNQASSAIEQSSITIVSPSRLQTLPEDQVSPPQSPVRRETGSVSPKGVYEQLPKSHFPTGKVDAGLDRPPTYSTFPAPADDVGLSKSKSKDVQDESESGMAIILCGLTGCLDNDEEESWDEKFEDANLAMLKTAVEDFEGNYTLFIARYKGYFRIRKNVQNAIKIAAKEDDLKLSARLFRKEIQEVIRAYDNKERARAKRWPGKLGKVVSKLYPLTRFSLQIASAISDVIPTS